MSLLFADAWMWQADRWLASAAAALFLPAGVYLLLSGLDDFAMDVCWLWRKLARRQDPARPAPEERRIAIWLPLWNEAAVIARMLEHNLAAIDYGSYEIFAGVYPNDEATRTAVEAAAARFARVHMAVTPRNGPTSKADCLNAIYRGMLAWEAESGRRIEAIVIHDAEDLIHPQSLRAINDHLEEADMVQLPVLPLATPWTDLTHGLYCDDFAESQGKDLETRVRLGGFLPGCGVGTGFRREAIDELARRYEGRVFSPDCLTEDYDIGLRLHKAGARQKFLPLRHQGGSLVATREYFPRSARAAIRQRTRWVTGNALQGWERHGWGSGLRRPLIQTWMLWRDRKGLWGNAVSLACNFLLAWGTVSWAAHVAAGRPWPLAAQLQLTPGLQSILAVNLFFLLARLAARMTATAQIYGWRFALGVAPRLVWGNWINARAALGAIGHWLAARWRRTTLGWAKTDHAFPGREALRQHKRSLAEILTSQGWCSPQAVAEAAGTLPPGSSLGESLLARGEISEEHLYAALSLQEGLPLAEPDASDLRLRVMRGLPARAVREWNVIPFRVNAGVLEVATPHPPDERAVRAISGLTRLEVRFFLMKASDYGRLTRTAQADGTTPLH